MNDFDFKSQDVVYSQDGEVFSFDHAVGEWAFLYPSVLIQISNSYNEGYEEIEEWAEHLVRRKLSSISKRPWLQKIDADSKHLIAVRQSELDELSKKIGTARVELAAAERTLADREKELITERSKLERQYQWVGDIKRMLGENDSVFFLLNDEGKPPVAINPPSDIRLKRDTDSNQYAFVAAYNYEEDNIQVFANENQRENAVRSLYYDIKERDVDTEIKWNRSWPFLTLSAEAQAVVKAKSDAVRATEIEQAQKRLRDAEDNLSKVQEGKSDYIYPEDLL